MRDKFFVNLLRLAACRKTRSFVENIDGELVLSRPTKLRAPQAGEAQKIL